MALADVGRGLRRALVVGVPSAEGHPPLYSTSFDARFLSDVLAEAGEFVVERLENPTVDEMMDRARALFDSASDEDHLWFHFSGHGDGLRGTLELSLADRSLRGHELSRLVARTRARTVVVTLDCCSSGTVHERLQPERLGDFGRTYNLAVLAASAKSQPAHAPLIAPTAGARPGNMSYASRALWEGLNGAAAPPGEPIGITALSRYVKRRVSELAEHAAQDVQEVQEVIFGPDWDAVPITSPRDRESLPLLSVDIEVRRHALVAAVTGSDGLPPLGAASRSREIVAGALTGAGYDVTHLQDPSAFSLSQELERLLSESAPDELLWFHFAGRVFAEGGELHLSCAGAESLSWDALRRFLRGTTAPVIVTLDCCDNPVRGQTVAFERLPTFGRASNLAVGISLAPDDEAWAVPLTNDPELASAAGASGAVAAALRGDLSVSDARIRVNDVLDRLKVNEVGKSVHELRRAYDVVYGPAWDRVPILAVDPVIRHESRVRVIPGGRQTHDTGLRPWSRERVFDLLRDHPIVILFGPPGSGKSTLVRDVIEIAATPAKEALAPLPLFSCTPESGLDALIESLLGPPPPNAVAETNEAPADRLRAALGHRATGPRLLVVDDPELAGDSSTGGELLSALREVAWSAPPDGVHLLIATARPDLFEGLPIVDLTSAEASNEVTSYVLDRLAREGISDEVRSAVADASGASFAEAARLCDDAVSGAAGWSAVARALPADPAAARLVAVVAASGPSGIPTRTAADAARLTEESFAAALIGAGRFVTDDPGRQAFLAIRVPLTSDEESALISEGSQLIAELALERWRRTGWLDRYLAQRVVECSLRAPTAWLRERSEVLATLATDHRWLALRWAEDGGRSLAEEIAELAQRLPFDHPKLTRLADLLPRVQGWNASGALDSGLWAGLHAVSGEPIDGEFASLALGEAESSLRDIALVEGPDARRPAGLLWSRGARGGVIGVLPAGEAGILVSRAPDDWSYVDLTTGAERQFAVTAVTATSSLWFAGTGDGRVLAARGLKAAGLQPIPGAAKIVALDAVSIPGGSLLGALDAEGRVFWLRSEDGEFRVEAERSFPQIRDQLRPTLGFVESGRLLFSAHNHSVLDLGTADSRSRSVKIFAEANTIYTRRDGTLVYICRDEQVDVFDVRSRNSWSAHHRSRINAVLPLVAGGFVTAAGDTLRVFGDRAERIGERPLPRDVLTLAEPAPNTIVAGDTDGGLTVMRLADAQSGETILAHESRVEALAGSGARIVSSDRTELRAWDTRTLLASAHRARTVSVDRERALHAFLISDGRRAFVTESAVTVGDRQFSIRDSSSARQPPRGAAALSDGRILVGALGHYICVIDGDDDPLARAIELRRPIQAIAAAPDDGIVAVTSNGWLWQVDAVAREARHVGEVGTKPTVIAVGRDGTVFAGVVNRVVAQLPDGARIEGPSMGTPTAVAVSPDGRVAWAVRGEIFVGAVDGKKLTVVHGPWRPGGDAEIGTLRFLRSDRLLSASAARIVVSDPSQSRAIGWLGAPGGAVAVRSLGSGGRPSWCVLAARTRTAVTQWLLTCNAVARPDAEEVSK